KCNQIRIDCSLSVSFTDYLHFFENPCKNIESLGIERLDRIENMWALAIEIAYYRNFTKYYLFLKSFKCSHQDKSRYKLEPDYKTFRMNDEFDEAKLFILHKLLLSNDYIGDIQYSDFRKVFTEQKFVVPDFKKIDWKLRNRGMDKQA